MVRRATLKLVTSIDEAAHSILRFEQEAARYPALRDRAGMVHAWYAVRDGANWRFAPSKWAGYRDVGAETYIAGAGKGGPLAGGQTEAVLKNWFSPVDLASPLGRELRDLLAQRLAAWGRRLRNPAGINIPSTDMEAYRNARGIVRLDDRTMERIAVDPDICGGRPFVRGTRVRVSDIIELMAAGADRSEILADYPYLADADISAALAYAAHATNHRVIRAA